MHEQLLGYLLEALEPGERDDMEKRLKSDSRLQQQLESLHESLEPLRADAESFEAPDGLAVQTCEAVALHRHSSPVAAGRRRDSAAIPKQGSPKGLSPEDCVSGPTCWKFADFVVAAGVFLAASMLLVPAIQNSRMHARTAACQNNLRELGTALARYSENNGGAFPAIPQSGNLAAAGLYAVRLMEEGYLQSKAWLVCPASSLAEEKETIEVPSIEQLQQADPARLVKLQKRMGGSYGYNLGYMEGETYCSPRNQRRATFALMADAPCSLLESRRSNNHGGCGQNVLYEDGHVGYLTQCSLKGSDDHIFLNDEGIVAAGVHPHDAVIGDSFSRPFPLTLVGFGRGED